MRCSLLSVRHCVFAAGGYVARQSARTVAAAGVVTTAFALTGCYSFIGKPVDDVPPKAIVSAEITDLGRVNLGARVGPEASQIEGTVLQKSDSGVTLLVSRVQYLNGLSNDWQGQSVLLTSQDIKSMSQKTFSRSRTVLTGGLGLLAVAVMATTGFLGFLSGNPTNDKGGGGGGEQ